MVNNNKLLVLRIFLYLVVVESLLTFIFLVYIPADSKTAVVLGFSATRLVLLSIVGAVFLLAVFMLFNFKFLAVFLNEFLLDSRKYSFSNFICLVFVGLGILFFLTPVQRVGEAVYYRLAPLIGLGFLVALQIVVGQFVWTERKLLLNQPSQWIRSLVIAGKVILLFILLWMFVAWSGIGIQPEPSGWFAPGTPLLAQQVLFAWIMGSFLIFLGEQYKKNGRTDLLISLALWIFAVLIWWIQPMHDWSYFTPKPTAPNFEYYPYSDAAIYDGFAQNMIIGSSRVLGVTNRPLYSLFLAFMHIIGGQKYENIIFLQIAVFAILPVFVYLLASQLGGRPAGVIAGLLVLLRERNSIALSNVIEVSHLKLLMSDVPTMTLMVAFIYIFVRWLQTRERSPVLGALAGGLFGLTVLIRSQSQLLIPIALLGLLLAWKFEWKLFARNSLIFIFSFLLVVTPWVIRNYQVSGRAVVEYQGFYTKIIASGYTSSPDEIEILPSETQTEYDKRMKMLILDFILKNPLEVIRFYSSYFIHNEISSVAILPMSFRFPDLYDYVEEMGYWSVPLGGLPVSIWSVFFMTLCVIAVGIGVVFYRYRWIGLMPLLFHLGYSLSVVPVRMSGWRYILPVDWVALLYFSVGLAQISAILFSLFSQDVKDIPLVEEKKMEPVRWKQVGATLLPFMLIGILFPLAEWSVPVRYPPLTVNNMIETYVSDGVSLEGQELIPASAIQFFIETEADATVLYGRSLYPAFYKQGEFWGESSLNLIEASKFSRLQFNLIGPSRAFVFLPMKDSPPYFPNASDVFIIGCKLKSGIRALIVKVNDHIVSSSPWIGLNCLELE